MLSQSTEPSLEVHPPVTQFQPFPLTCDTNTNWETCPACCCLGLCFCLSNSVPRSLFRCHPCDHITNGPRHRRYRLSPYSSFLHLGGRPLFGCLHGCSSTRLYIPGFGKNLSRRNSIVYFGSWLYVYKKKYRYNSLTTTTNILFWKYTFIS